MAKVLTMKIFPSIYIIISAAATLSGCASILSGTEDRITINSMTSDTIILVDSIPRGTNSAEVTVDRGSKHIITASKKGCADTSVTTGQGFDHKSLLGIFIDFGLITIPADFFTGAAWKTHPSSYTITPECPNNGS